MNAVCHPLTLERYGNKGWFHLSCDDIPGINLCGPDLDDLFAGAEIAIAELLRRRGVSVQRVVIETVPDAQTEAPVWAASNHPMAMAIAA